MSVDPILIAHVFYIGRFYHLFLLNIVVQRLAEHDQQSNQIYSPEARRSIVYKGNPASRIFSCVF